MSGTRENPKSKVNPRRPDVSKMNVCGEQQNACTAKKLLQRRGEGEKKEEEEE